MLHQAELRPTADALLIAAVGASNRAERMRLIDEAIRLHAEAVETLRARLQEETTWDLAADGPDGYFRPPPDRPLPDLQPAASITEVIGAGVVQR